MINKTLNIIPKAVENRLFHITYFKSVTITLVFTYYYKTHTEF